jgi:hypothetical protein
MMLQRYLMWGLRPVHSTESTTLSGGTSQTPSGLQVTSLGIDLRKLVVLVSLHLRHCVTRLSRSVTANLWHSFVWNWSRWNGRSDHHPPNRPIHG